VIEAIPIAHASELVRALADAINANRAHLSEVDGAIGDGDHGINMSKGFTAAAARLPDPPGPLPEALASLGDTLMQDVGGSMGPLYGTFFTDMAGALQGHATLDAPLLGRALNAARDGVQEMGGAKPGDKTMLDALVPALDAYDAALARDEGFAAALDAMSAAAEQGRDATTAMVARIGRAARLGERSRGVMDAGASSCCLLLQTTATWIKGALERSA
jgi:dihydroxyacetone kinase phosphoprotein-dependent L subunit